VARTDQALRDAAHVTKLQFFVSRVTANSMDQFRDTTHEVIVWPNEYKTGTVIYPYADAKKQ